MAKKDTPAADEAAPATVKARVLTACTYGVANDVVSVTPEEAAAGQADGVLCTTAEEVAYAESLASA